MSKLSVYNIQGLSQYNNTVRIPSGHKLSFDGNLKLPLWTTATRPATAAAGYVGFNTDDNIVEIYDGTDWLTLTLGGGITPYTYLDTDALYYVSFNGASDLTDLKTNTSGSVGNTNTRNFVRDNFSGLYVSGGGYFDHSSSIVNQLGNDSTWTVEWHQWDFANGAGSLATKLEFNQYPYGILYRGQSTSVDHYWRGSQIGFGAVPRNSWCHIALVGNGANITTYINGVPYTTVMNGVGTSAFGNPFNQGSSTFRIGASNHTTPTNQYSNTVFRNFRVSQNQRYTSRFDSSTLYPLDGFVSNKSKPDMIRQMVNTTTMPHCADDWNVDRGGWGTSLANRLSARALSDTGNGFAMHTGHDGASDFEMYVGIDFKGDYPNGVVLNQLIFTVHVNGFGRFDIDGSNDTNTWSSESTGLANATQGGGINVRSGNWTTIASNLNMNGSGSGLADGTNFVVNFTNSTAYKKYRIRIKDFNNAGGFGGWACYGWCWNKI